MQTIARTIRRFAQDTTAVTATEYGIMLALIVVVALVGLAGMGGHVSEVFSTVDTSMPTGGNGS